MKQQQKKRKIRGWMTTDADEREIRRERAKVEPMRVKAMEGKEAGAFQSYMVSHAEGRQTDSYQVEIRALNEPINTCSCPDFAKNGLGTCKHIERALQTARRAAKADEVFSPHGEIFMRRNPWRVAFRAGRGLGAGLTERIGRLFSSEGELLDGTASGLAALLATVERINCKTPGAVRVSAEVVAHAEQIRRTEALRSAVGDFAAQTASADGQWPFLKYALYPYQVEGALHLATKGRAILADEMGLGKTIQAIAAAKLLQQVAGVKRVLVVVPASLKGEWDDQIRQFTDENPVLLMGARQNRLAQYRSANGLFLVANYEQIFRDWREVNALYRPDLIILDEAQRIKNWSTKTARNFKRLESPYAFVLTGTPLENRIDEFYSLAEFVDPKLFGSLFRFNRAYYKFDEDGKAAGMQNLADLHEKASTIMLRRRKDLVEDELPERTDKTYFVEMTPEQQARHEEYKVKVARLCFLAKKRPLTQDEMKRLQKFLACMRMLCDTCYILDPEIREAPKVEEAIAVLNDLFASEPSRKVVIFSEWVKMLELMEERLREEGIGFAVHTGSVQQLRRREELKRFKGDPSCRVLLSSESGGVGLNLQAASVIMNLDLPWNPAKLEQRIARAWRKHQTRDVLVINLVSERTIEHAMIATLKFKQGLADAVLDARGDLCDFEKPSARKAFLARVNELMEQDLPAVVSANGTKTLTDESGQDDAPSPSADASGLEREKERVLATIDPALLQQLERLGLITLGDELRNRLKPREETKTDAELRQEAHAKREQVARAALEKAARGVRMGEVLMAGGFAEEAEDTCRKAIALAANAPRFFMASTGEARPEEVPDRVEPLTTDELVVAQDELDLDADAVLTLQLSVQALPLPDCVARAKRFLEECRLMV